jgi:phage shock protein PspC (stress-responsive transcriptional regulator)
MKKIYRSIDDRKLAGICGGIADMMTVDSTIVRIICVFITVITGIWPGMVAYLAGWVLIPEKTENQ